MANAIAALMVCFLNSSQKAAIKTKINREKGGISTRNSENILLIMKGPCHRSVLSISVPCQIPFTFEIPLYNGQEIN